MKLSDTTPILYIQIDINITKHEAFFFHPYMDMYQSYYEHRFAILFYDMAYEFNRKYRIERRILLQPTHGKSKHKLAFK